MDVPGRLAKTLLNLASRFGEPVEAGLKVPHDLTQEEMAQLVGSSRETVNKALMDSPTVDGLRVRAVPSSSTSLACLFDDRDDNFRLLSSVFQVLRLFVRNP